MENTAPTTSNGSQDTDRQERKRPHSDTIASQGERSCTTKKPRTRGGSDTSIEITEVATTSGTAILQDGYELPLNCTFINIPMVASKDFNREIQETDLSKPDFDYSDLCGRLLSLESFQNIESDLWYEEYGLLSANSCTNCTSVCQSQQNIGSISIQPSICDLYRPLCGMSCTLIRDAKSENRLSPTRKPHHFCSQCEIAYPCESSGSEHEECGVSDSSPMESEGPRYMDSDYLQRCIEHINQENIEMIDSSARIPTDAQPSTTTSPKPFAFQNANDVSPQEQEKLPQISNFASSSSRQLRRYFIIMWIDKTERTIENADGSTALPYITKVTTNNNLPCEVFNPNPRVPIEARFVGINNHEVLKRIDYFSTAFDVCNIVNPEMGMTQVLVVGINPNGENLVIGSIPHTCKLVVSKDVRGIRRVIIQTTQD